MSVNSTEINVYYDEESMRVMAADGRHRNIIGGLWDEIGTLQIEFLKAHGLAPSDIVIDIGCGCLRGGVHFIDYLDAGNYHGIDLSAALLDAGYDVELAGLGLQDKLPRSNLLADGQFGFDHFGKRFDVALAQSVFTHLPLNHIRLCLHRLAATMRPGGRLFATFFEAPEHHPLDQPFDNPNGVRSFSHQDPFHYKLSEIEAICREMPWRIVFAGDWAHPRDQKMVIFERIADMLPTEQAPVAAVRQLTADEAAALPPGADHYRAYVGPPDRFDFMSATQFSLLFALGLRDHHFVLDFGCGSLRLGRLLIPFLQAGRYHGIDPNRWLIEDGLSRELGWSAAGIKAPCFAYNDDFRCDSFGRRFDFIVAQSIITHCGPALSRLLLAEMAKVLEPGGKIIFSIIEAPWAEQENVAEGWLYPGCVGYRRETILQWCAEAGLIGQRLPWYHPGAVWYMAAKDPSALPTLNQLSVLSGSVLFDPQFTRSRPPARTDANPANPLRRRAELSNGSGRDLGQARLLSADRVEVASYQELRVRYTVGPAGIATGGKLRLASRHITDYAWSEAQISRPDEPGYVRAAGPDGAALHVAAWADHTDPLDQMYEAFPWQQIIEITVQGRPLVFGDAVDIVFGDRTRGGPGAKVQFYCETPFRLRCSVDPDGRGVFRRVPDDLEITITAGPAVRLVAVLPSDAVVGMPVRLLIKAEDAFGNVATGFRGAVELRQQGGGAVAPRRVLFDDAASGLVWLDDVIFAEPGDYTIVATDGGLAAESNPVRVRAPASGCRSIFWGEIHGHTVASDGRGTIEQYYDYAETVAGLDVCAVTDHDFMITDNLWAESKRITNARNRPGRFVTLQGFEWSGTSPVGGDHNIYFADEDPPIVRSRLFYDYRNRRMYQGDAVCANHIEDVYNFLTANCQPGRVAIAAHFGGRPANPKWHHPEFVRLIEVFSECQRSETWAMAFHKSGYRMGIIASGDNHIGRPGNGCLHFDSGLRPQPYGLGLIAFQANELTREAIFRALYDRRVYATTGARIVLDVSVNGAPMGSEITSATAPDVAVEVIGTAPITVVQVIKDWQVVHKQIPHPSGNFDTSAYFDTYADVAAAAHGSDDFGYFHYKRHGFSEGRQRFAMGLPKGNVERSIRFRWTDPDFVEGAAASYVIRVVQDDGSLAISSPVWVN
jgi:SAM-dependent methyltransferase